LSVILVEEDKVGSGKGKSQRASARVTGVAPQVVSPATGSKDLPSVILTADSIAREGDLIKAGGVYDAYLTNEVTEIKPPVLPISHPDHAKLLPLLTKLSLAESELANSNIERALSFNQDGRLWYYNVGEEPEEGESHEVGLGIAAGLIVTHNHPLRSDGRHTSTFSPADVDMMARYRDDGVYLQEMRMVDDRYLCVMRRERDSQKDDPQIGVMMEKSHPNYVAYSEEEREQLHHLLKELAPQAGIQYVRVAR
jgi:hypothetical protein